MSTSVWTSPGSMPGARQNSELVVGEGVHDVTSHLRLASACMHLVGVGPDAGRRSSRDSIRPSILPLSAWSKMREPRRVRGRLGDVVEGELVALRGRVAVPRLEQADHELPVVRRRRSSASSGAPSWARSARRSRRGCAGPARDPQVAGQDLPRDRVVGVALDVGVAALGVHAAARAPHVAEQELEHRAGADELRRRWCGG